MNPQELVHAIVNAELPQQRVSVAGVAAGRVAVGEHAVSIYRRTDQWLARMPFPEGQRLACKEGCSYCCHYQVYIQAHEAFAIADHVATMSPAARQDVLSRLEANTQTVAKLTPAQHRSTNVKCAFLTDAGACGIYDLRPLACRRHHSMDVSICKSTFEDPLSDKGNAWNIALCAVGDGVLAATTLTMREGGLDPSRFEMSGAVLEAATNPAARTRWRAGKLAFPSVKDVDRTGGLP